MWLQIHDVGEFLNLYLTPTIGFGIQIENFAFCILDSRAQYVFPDPKISKSDKKCIFTEDFAHLA